MQPLSEVLTRWLIDEGPVMDPKLDKAVSRAVGLLLRAEERHEAAQRRVSVSR